MIRRTKSGRICTNGTKVAWILTPVHEREMPYYSNSVAIKRAASNEQNEAWVVLLATSLLHDADLYVKKREFLNKRKAQGLKHRDQSCVGDFDNCRDIVLSCLQRIWTIRMQIRYTRLEMRPTKSEMLVITLLRLSVPEAVELAPTEKM